MTFCKGQTKALPAQFVGNNMKIKPFHSIVAYRNQGAVAEFTRAGFKDVEFRAKVH